MSFRATESARGTERRRRENTKNETKWRTPSDAMRAASGMAGPAAQPTTSWWLERMKTDAAVEGVVPLEMADVVIIGAGMSGLSVAYHLARLSSERSVLVVDARDVAGGASGRNGGHLTPAADSDFEKETTEELLAFIETARIDCDLMKGGKMKRTEGDEESGAENLIPDSFQFFPAKVCAGLLREAQRLKNDIIFAAGVRVDGIEHKWPRLELRWTGTSNGRSGVVQAQQVVVCTNGWLDSLLPEFSNVFYGARNQVLMTAPLPAENLKSWTTNGMGSWERASGEIYAIRRADNRICIGGARALEPNEARNNTDDATLNSVVGDALRRKITSLTGLSEVPVEGEWTGVLGFTTDGNALIGRVPGRESVYICGGFNGHVRTCIHTYQTFLSELLSRFCC